MNGHNILTDREKDRESSCQTLPCPNCGAVPGRRCAWGMNKDGRSLRVATSHTGRYLAAVAAGLVPGLIGSRWFPWMS